MALFLRAGPLLLAFSLCFSTSLFAAEPWDTPFHPDAAKSLQAAYAIPTEAGQHVVLLREEHRYVLDEKGRSSWLYRLVYRVLLEDAVEEWATMEHTYEPWHEEKPQFRARVITKDGAAHWLDAKTIADAPEVQSDATIFSDARVLQAPLPAVAPGCLVEIEMRVRETNPRFAAGISNRTIVRDYLPLQRFVFSVEAPDKLPLHIASQLLETTSILRTSSGGRTRVELTLGPQRVRKNTDYSLPSDISVYPYIGFSTAPSWQAVATHYASIVDEQIKSAAVESLTSGIDRSHPPAVVIAALTARLHQQIRYTGIEFGQSALVPHTPAETIQRRYGDCKDKSALLVAALRSLGIRAHLALLNTGPGRDIDTSLPGFGLFDHAIVRTEGASPIWIDATAEYFRPGHLPSAVQGRLALVADPSTSAPILIPESSSAENRQTHIFEIHMSSSGAGSLTETLRGTGLQETGLRSSYSSEDEKGVRENIERYTKNDLAAESLQSLSYTKAKDLSQPFQLTIAARNSRRSFTSPNDASVALDPRIALSDLPYALTAADRTGEPSADGENAPKKRTQPFYNDSPYSYDLLYRIYPPKRHKLKEPPPTGETKLLTGSFSRTFRELPDGAFEVGYHFDSGKRRLAPGEFETLRSELKPLLKTESSLLTFVPQIGELIALGKYVDAVSLARQDATTPEASAPDHIVYSRALLAAGLGAAARRAAQAAVAAAPESSAAWQALGWAWQHDYFGRRFRGNWSLQESEKAYRKAVELTPDDAVPAADLAILLEHNAAGTRYGDGARLDEAVRIYRSRIEKAPHEALNRNLAIALMYAGQIDDLRAEVRNSPSLKNDLTISAVSTALSSGSDAAIVQAQSATPDPAQRANLLASASATLTLLRRYDLAKPIMAAAARQAPSGELQGRLTLLNQLSRVEDAKFDENDPSRPVHALMTAVFRGEITEQALRPLVSEKEQWSNTQNDLTKLRRVAAVVIGQFGSIGFTPYMAADLVMSLTKFEKVKSESSLHRIDLVPMQGKTESFFVAPEDGRLRILGSQSSMEMLGLAILDLLGAGKLTEAQQWLDSLITVVRPSDSDGTGWPAVRSLWSGVTKESRGAAAARLAAAAMVARDGNRPDAVAILVAGRKAATLTLDRAQIDYALCEAYVKANKWDLVLSSARTPEILKHLPDVASEFQFRAIAQLGQWDELKLRAEARLKKNEKDRKALRALVRAYSAKGDHKKANETMKRITGMEFADDDDKLAGAWLTLRSGEPAADSIAAIESLLKPRQINDRAVYYALAALQAASGKHVEATQSLQTGLNLDEFDALDARVWSTYAAITNAYGLTGDARAALAKAAAADNSGDQEKLAAEYAAILAAALPAAQQ